MNSTKVQNKLFVSQNIVPNAAQSKGYASAAVSSNMPCDSISFQGMGEQATKKGWYYLRRLSFGMKNISEITNAVIAAIGTGIIAPMIILVSPGKGDKEDKDKKFLQAIRQPLSAVLALGFQVPATKGVNKFINYLAYDKKIPLFDDKTLGSLIPDKKYLAKQVTPQEIADLAKDFDKKIGGKKSLKEELEEIIKADYEEVGLTVSDEDLAKRVSKEKENFLREKVVDKKHNALLEAKVKELKKSKKIKKIKDIDLVTDDYRELAKEKFSKEYKAIEEGMNLSWKDKLARTFGFETKNLKTLKDKQKTFTTNKGLELLQQDDKELFKNPAKKMKKFIEASEKASQDIFGKKKFWLSLLVNLFMVSASCYALNWAHPRFNEMIEKWKANKADQQSTDDKKVEVR